MQSIITQGKVHFYQYMQIEILQEYIQKGISYFVNAVLNSHVKLIKLRYWSQQISLLIDVLKDLIYLTKYSSTYAQYFYGLQRQKLKQNKPLKSLQIILHCLCSTLLPYILQKLQSLYNNLIEQEQNDNLRLSTWQKLFTKIYPYFHLVWNLVQGIMKFRYLIFQKAKLYDLNYALVKEQLVYRQEEQQQGKVQYPWKDLIKSPGLLTILISHKLITWYFANKNQRKLPTHQSLLKDSKNSSPLSNQIVFGKNEQKRQDQIQKKRAKQYKKGICLICGKQQKSPTVIKQNGHVYCYSCISQYIKSNGKCPITNIQITLQSLQLIY